MKTSTILAAILIQLNYVTLLQAQSSAQCEKRSCYPATGDLLVGRHGELFASSTCGLRGPERYCMVSNLKEQEECSICDSRNISDTLQQYGHLPQFMQSNFDGDNTEKWWQSQNGKENVYLQLDMKSQFHFTHLIMTFRSFRPAGMLIERSFDLGRTWHVYRYFAANCEKTFPGIPKGEPKDIDDIICTEQYSTLEPFTGGEVIFRALKSQEPIEDPYSPKVQNLLKLTNIRINFTKLHTLGDTILDPRPEIKRKYYYAIYDLVIRGSCSCYGHAEQCLPLPGQPRIAGMVYGQCNCTHNTTGNNCERCKDGYFDVPWRPASTDSPNECRKCNCNGHAIKCRFDPAVYLASGNISGGVCENCTHNTVGRNCESCKPLHYQDPNKDFTEPDACIPCNCDFEGGVSGGECEAKNDPSKGLLAGRCICKTNVVGERCDQCKPGYYGLSASNFEGCQACGCSSLGTLRKCNPVTGECTCKRYVEGEKCDRCLVGYWGLSDSPAGCQPCGCDVGGSYDNQCEKISGQCRCRKGINGRQCDRVKPGYYFPLPDHLVYESEEARAIGASEVKRQQPAKNGRSTWTGDGFLDVSSDTSVVYSITNVPRTSYYDILLRYETKDADPWDAVVTISRDDGQSLTSGVCSRIGVIEHYRNVTVRLNPSQRYSYVPGNLCMEKGVTYDVRVKFIKKSNFGSDSIFTDSIVLLPDPNKVSIFEGPDGRKRKQQFDVYQCMENHREGLQPRPVVSEVCKGLIFSTSAVVYDGSLACKCDPTGTKRDINGSLICDPVGGQCLCKPNVIGQRCDRCAPGSYGFGPSGCSACECDVRGSVDVFCNIVSGQCPCHSWASGRQCSLCPPKKWGFPSCYDCVCHNHASTCDANTGHCINCQHNTVGKNCEQCAVGYFGIATTGKPYECQRCQCPRIGIQYSKTCILDPTSTTTPPTALCNACEHGYTGKQCEKCADGFYGTPIVGVSCKRCLCNNNINPLSEGNCDPVTGGCKKCVANTAGFSCERCAPGYYGNAIVRNCTKCVCNPKGTAPAAEGSCNHETGQCKCLPDVEGIQCDRCAEGFWNLASGKGCEQCDCCEKGSKKAMCNQSSGQCYCKAGFGGPRCCECEHGYWGNPPDSCNPCDCNPAGSIDLQCDRDTGACRCLVGHVGEKCDMCAADTTGKMPKCEVCGECYYQWKITLKNLHTKVTVQIGRAANLTVSGSGGGGIYAYEKELEALEKKLQRVRQILNTQVTNENSTKMIEAELNMADKRISDVMNVTELVTKDIDRTINRTSAANEEIIRLRKILEGLLKKAEDLKKKITDIREKEFTGAFEGIKENQRRSRAAEAQVNGSLDNIEKASNNRKHIETILNGPPSFNETHQKNKISLDDIFRRIRVLTDQSEMLSAMVCGTPRDKCGCVEEDCSSCGGPGCNGTRSLSMEAVKMAMKAEAALQMKEAKANAILEEALQAEMKVNMSRDAAITSLDSAKQSLRQATNASERMNLLVEDILKFLALPIPDTSGAKALTEKILNMSLSVGPEQIKELRSDIENALKSLTGIDEILEKTKGNISRADDLKSKAEKARAKALGVQNVIDNVTKALDMTAKAQQTAAGAITQATEDTDKAEDIIKGLFPELEELEKKIDQAQNSTKQTKEDVVPIKAEFDDNAKKLVMAEDSVREAHKESQKAIHEAERLKKLFEEARFKIKSKVDKVNNATGRVANLKRKANILQRELVNKITRITIIERETVTYDNLIDELKKLREEMREIKKRIESKIEWLDLCNPATNVPAPPP